MQEPRLDIHAAACNAHPLHRQWTRDMTKWIAGKWVEAFSFLLARRPQPLPPCVRCCDTSNSQSRPSPAAKPKPLTLLHSFSQKAMAPIAHLFARSNETPSLLELSHAISYFVWMSVIIVLFIAAILLCLGGVESERSCSVVYQLCLKHWLRKWKSGLRLGKRNCSCGCWVGDTWHGGGCRRMLASS